MQSSTAFWFHLLLGPVTRRVDDAPDAWDEEAASPSSESLTESAHAGCVGSFDTWVVMYTPLPLPNETFRFWESRFRRLGYGRFCVEPPRPADDAPRPRPRPARSVDLGGGGTPE